MGSLVICLFLLPKNVSIQDTRGLVLGGSCGGLVLGGLVIVHFCLKKRLNTRPPVSCIGGSCIRWGLVIVHFLLSKNVLIQDTLKSCICEGDEGVSLVAMYFLL